MSAHLLGEIRQYLPELEATQREFVELLQQKRQALISALPEELLRLSTAEAQLANRLHEHLKTRQRILSQARAAGLPSESISELTSRIAGDEQEQLQEDIRRLRVLSATLRRECWVHWIISNRTYSHYSELLNLIEHRGKKAPTYSRDVHDRRQAAGGAILDASI